MSSSNQRPSASQREDLSQTTTDPSSLNNFSDYVSQRKTEGINGYGKPDYYVSISNLEEYWMESRVKNILHSFNPPINVDIDDIIKRYLRTFSILVHINHVPYISFFLQHDYDDDRGLPYTETMPSGLPKTDETRLVWENILKNQWIFCPFQFGPKMIYRRPLDQRWILPITVIDQLTPDTRDEEAAVVQVVQLHPDYNKLSPDPPRKIVFKKYISQRSKELWDNEVGIFMSIKGQGPCEQIVEYYGSFSQGETYTTMLEYAERGTLLDVMKSTQPLSRGESLRLWVNLTELFRGLVRIHGLENPDPQGTKRTYVLRTIHLDIKPANILVFRGETDEPFDFRFKLADFSSSHIRKAFAWGKDTKGSETGGTQMYSAVECCRDFRFLANAILNISSDVDIWSLGCVFSEVLVWTTMGPGGLERYRIRRKQATDKVSRMLGSGYDGCFHDGENRLDCVETMHHEAEGNRARWDEITPAISDLILENMLQTATGGRLVAIQLYRRFEQKLSHGPHLDPTNPTKKGKENYVHPRKSGESANATVGHEDENENEPGFPDKPWPNSRNGVSEIIERPPKEFVDLKPSSTSAILGLNNASKAGTWAGAPSSSAIPSRHKSSREAPRQLPPVVEPEGQPEPETESEPEVAGPAKVSKQTGPTVTAREVNIWRTGKKKGLKTKYDLPGLIDAQNKLKDRDHLFLVDDSKSMDSGSNWDKVVEVFHALAYIVKEADPDGLEIFFTSEHTKPHKNKNAGPLAELVKKRRSSGGLIGTCNMSLCLDHIVGNIISSNIEGKQSGNNFWPRRSRPNVSTSRPISIYILTNGVWEPPNNSVCGVDKAVIRLIKALEDSNKPASHVALQFVRFGEDPTGVWRLSLLDDMAKTDPDKVTMDIVDHTPHDGNVWKMLIGSLSEAMDND